MKKFPVIFRFTGIFFAYLQKSADSLGRFLKKRTIRLNWAFSSYNSAEAESDASLFKATITTKNMSE